MAKYSAGQSDSDIQQLRADLDGQAKVIRNCTCDRGYIIGRIERNGVYYQGVAMCGCMKEFKRIGRLLNEAVRDWEKANGREFHDLITPKMLDHSHETGTKPSPEMMARARQSIYNAGQSFDIPE
jgi:hypothetical protein